jgi:hypothetical protein
VNVAQLLFVKKSPLQIAEEFENGDRQSKENVSTLSLKI